MATEHIEKLEPGEAPATPPARKRSIIIFVVVSLINLSLLALLWTQLLTPGANAPKTIESIVGNASTPLQGKPAPDFTLPTLNGPGEQVHLKDFKGKAVLLNFWYSECPPCKDEAPFLQSVWPKLQSQNAVLLGINTGDKSEEAALAFMSKYGITYPNVFSTDTAINLDYGTTGQPETFLIDKQGNVVARWRGPIEENGLREILAKVDITL